MKQRTKFILTLASALFGLATITQGIITISVYEDNADVVAIASGSANTMGLSLGSASDVSPVIAASSGVVHVGNGLGDYYSGISGPASISGSTVLLGTPVSGDTVGVFGGSSLLYVTNGYISGSPLNGEARWIGETLSSIGLNEGEYTWTWGSGDTADSLTLTISQAAAVPEPSTYSVVVGLIGFLGMAFYRRRAA